TTPEQREALELAVRHRLAAHEVAAVLGMDLATARELLASAACEVERTRAALAVVETGTCPSVARLTGDHQLVLSSALRRELVRHVDDCPRCRRTAERAVPGTWPGAGVTPAELPVLEAPRAALHVAMAHLPADAGAGPRARVGKGDGKGGKNDVSVEVISVAGTGGKGAGRLAVSAANSADTTLVTLTASGAAPVRWSATTTAPWLYLSQSSGTLAPGESLTIKVYVDHLREPSGPWTARVAVSPAGAVVSIEGYGSAPAPTEPGEPSYPSHPDPGGPPSSGPDPTPTETAPTGPTPSDPPPSSADPDPTPTDSSSADPGGSAPPSDGGEPGPS
ncbi:hypothetical protein JHN45_52595, partial [Streptomyces sp. MBT53]|nr:hypothetical protein [Streptomyces sp. MBT53]